MKVVSWFSAGAASAVACKMLLTKGHDITVARIVIDNEHPDNNRFAADCAKWFGRPIVELRSDRYRDCWEVWEKRRFLVGPSGALCTTEMKKMVRQDYTVATDPDAQAFGYTSEELDRARKFRANNPEVRFLTPLIDAGLSKSDCLAMIQNAGIELPAMYRLGYHNNNCIGCVKGGAGYWNKIRVDFPDVFDRMARLERTLGRTICKVGSERVYLDALPADAGKHENSDIDCSLLCVMAEQEMAP